MTMGDLTITENVIGGEMSKDQVERALAILTRWATRKAQKRAERELKPGSKVVTVDSINGYTARKAEN